MGIIELGDKVIKKKVKPITNNKKQIISLKENILPNKTKLQIFSKSNNSKIVKKKTENIEMISYKKYAGKELFEKFGVGLASQQYINILLSEIGVSYFLIGIFNGFKDLSSIFTAIFVQEYLKIKSEEVWKINLIGLLLGISYLLVGIGLFTNSIYFVGLTLIFIGMFSTYLGQVYANTYIKDIKEKVKLRIFPQYSVIFIGISLLVGSYILDNYPMHGKLITLGNFGVPGYFLLISIAAICFIISSQFLRSLIIKQRFEIETSMMLVIKDHFIKIFKQAPILIKNKIILIALIAGTMTGIVQTMGNIYYGLYIYKIFKYMAFGGFTNIAMIFIISISTALMSTTISKMLSKKYGNLPLLSFGTLMVAIQPLAYYFSPNLLAISMATMIGVIGASITGLSIGLLITHALAQEDITKYYNIFSFLLTIPYIIFIPLGSYYAQVFGLQSLFLILGLSLAFLVTPFYFILQASLGKKIA